jgi:hypothetical protein
VKPSEIEGAEEIPQSEPKDPTFTPEIKLIVWAQGTKFEFPGTADVSVDGDYLEVFEVIDNERYVVGGFHLNWAFKWR